MNADVTLGRAAEYLARKGLGDVSVACVLGSGLGAFADNLSNTVTVEAETIPGFPRQTVPGHSGKIVHGTIGGSDLLLLQGRSHLYESGNLAAVLFPVRLIHALGIRTIILTNAAGGISPGLDPGDLMLITDQLNLTFRVLPPVAEPPVNRMLLTYSSDQRRLFEEAAIASQVRLRSGVYAGMIGPSYETAAEIRMLRRLGADAVGMSTVGEASYAAALGMNVAGISCITNRGTGLSPGKLSHEEVTDVGRQVAEEFKRLLLEYLQASRRKISGGLAGGRG